MNSENLLQPLNHLLIQAQTLLNFVQAEDWESLQTQFSDYQQHMSLLADPTYLQALQSANQASEAQALILQIQNINQQLDSSAEQVHANVASELRQIIQADKALDAYRR